MPRGNPQNFKPLTKEEARERGRKGGKKSGEVRRKYASLRECISESMDDEKKKLFFEKLWDLYYKDSNLNAAEMIVKLMDEQTDKAQNNVTITFASEAMKEYGD